MNKKDLLKYIRSIEQIGGNKDFTFNDVSLMAFVQYRQFEIYYPS